MILGLWLLATAAGAASARAAEALQVEVPAGPLAEALRALAVQTHRQILFEQSVVSHHDVARLAGAWSVEHALDRLLANTGLQWRTVDAQTIAVYRPAAATAAVPEPVPSTDRASRAANVDDGVSQLSDIYVLGERPSLMAATDASGFSKPVLETPRAVSFVGGDAIDAFSLTAVEDLLRLVPGVFTTTRFGVQGSVDVRGVPGDTFLRGMKRLTLQGHGRSVFAAMDSIEVVAGPAAPLYGLGKIGGYTNLVPKSGRASSGRFLSSPEGFVQAIGGTYQRRELSGGLGGPMSPGLTGGRQGGYYLYGLVEDSGSYAKAVPVKQQLLQAASSVADAVGHFRLETGANYQVSETAGALTGRLTQRLVDEGEYIAGQPLVNLDLNGNGRIGYLEMQQASPVRGALSAANQPLNQVFAWPRDARGAPLPLDQFPRITGIPAAMYGYLQAHPEADPGGLLRARGVGGPVPLSGAVPAGMMLNPATVHFASFDPRRSAAYERGLEARFLTAYADLVDDQHADGSVRNQLFFDSMQQFKSSNQPFSQVQTVRVVEDKFTAQERFAAQDQALAVTALLTMNVRHTLSEGRMTLGDYGNHRGDASAADWNAAVGGMTPNTTFTSSNDVATLADDGLPWGSLYRSEFTEFGLGAMADITLPSAVNVVVGARYDYLQARNVDFAGRFNVNAGTSAAPGQYLDSDDVARRSGGAPSWSVSVSQAWPGQVRPYLTYARSSILLDGNNNSLTNAVIRAGPIGRAVMKEAGLKGSWREGALSFTASVFEQGRADVDATDDANLLNAYATATVSRGWQSELRLAPSRRALLGLYAVREITRYEPNVGATVQIDARALGFQDVLDARGNVVYPAEAFLYGGRARIALPDGLPQYARKQGNPDLQVGAFGSLEAVHGWGASLRANYLSSTCTGRLCLVRLPASLVFDVGLFRHVGRTEVKLDVFNAGDRHYFRARTGDTLGDVIAQAMPDRRWQFTIRRRL